MDFMETKPHSAIRTRSADDLGCGWSALHMLTSLALNSGLAERKTRTLDEPHTAVVLPFCPSAA